MTNYSWSPMLLAAQDVSSNAPRPGYFLPIATLIALLLVSLIVVARGAAWRVVVTMLAAPLLLVLAGWLIEVAHWPVLPVMIGVGAVALSLQVVLLVESRGVWLGALVAAWGGYAIAVLIALASLQAFRITGVYSTVLSDLWHAHSAAQGRFHYLAAGTIALLGAGVIADLAVAVAATIAEVRATSPRVSRLELYRAGMRFGRDVISTEINTLPLAVLGVSLGGVLLAFAPVAEGRAPFSWMLLVNRQHTAVEVLALATGTIALVLTIPLTAWLVARRLAEGGHSSFPNEEKCPPFWKRAWPRVVAVGAICFAVAGASRHLADLRYDYPPTTDGTRTTLIRGTVKQAKPELSTRLGADLQRGGEHRQSVEVLTASGRVTAENILTGVPEGDIVAAPGDRLILRVVQADGEQEVLVRDLERDRLLLLPLGICALVVLAVAGWQGCRALVGMIGALAIIGVAIWFIVRGGWPPVLSALAACALASGWTYLVLWGRQRKTLAALAGTTTGLAAAAIVAWIFSRWLGLSGLYDEDLLAYAQITPPGALDYRALLVAATLLAALGVVLDVAVGVVSAASEVVRAEPTIGRRALFSSGMAVGRKILAAMVGAILFAFLALNLALFLLPWARGGTMTESFATEQVVTELFRLLVASLAIVWTIPASAALAAWLLTSPPQPD